MALRGLNSPIKSPQLKISAIPYRVVITTGTPSISGQQGAESLTLTDNGTGDITLTLRNPAKRIIISGAPISETADLKATAGATPTAAAVRFLFTNNSGTAVDPAAFSGVLFVSDDITLRA